MSRHVFDFLKPIVNFYGISNVMLFNSKNLYTRKTKWLTNNLICRWNIYTCTHLTQNCLIISQMKPDLIHTLIQYLMKQKNHSTKAFIFIFIFLEFLILLTSFKRRRQKISMGAQRFPFRMNNKQILNTYFLLNRTFIVLLEFDFGLLNISMVCCLNN